MMTRAQTAIIVTPSGGTVRRLGEAPPAAGSGGSTGRRAGRRRPARGGGSNSQPGHDPETCSSLRETALRCYCQ